ncbi:hypothetical protein Ancab_016268 [Ancistrocladus abbreviatus]
MALMSPSSLSSGLTLLAFLSATTFYCFYKSLRLRSIKHVNNSKTLSLSSKKPKLLYVSQTGTSKTLAQRLHKLLVSNNLIFDLVDVNSYEPEDLAKETLVLIVTSTWEDGKPPPSALFFANWIEESVNDFRVGSLLLRNCRFAVFGVGSRAYGESFNAVARGFSRKLKRLGGKEVLPLWEGDVDGGELDREFDSWGEKLIRVLKGGVVGNSGANVCGGTCRESDLKLVELSEDEEEGESGMEFEIVDLEDIAGKGPLRNSKTAAEVNGVKNGQKEMVTPVIRANLEKQGYKIIGSHSGVKLCRWTKSQLRGRGGCYKHSFYGIESHRCMEATPSLACANKCVFCWRHHTNPVGRSWQWKMDDPLEIVNTAVELHTKMINQMKGVPVTLFFSVLKGIRCTVAIGVLQPRHKARSEDVLTEWQNLLLASMEDGGLGGYSTFLNLLPWAVKSIFTVAGVKEEQLLEGLQPRHCALSLVGEPIMYPEMNSLVDELHRREISTFLVTNAQFPDKIRMLKPVTQLYVSVDAATKESLKAIGQTTLWGLLESIHCKL